MAVFIFSEHDNRYINLDSVEWARPERGGILTLAGSAGKLGQVPESLFRETIVSFSPADRRVELRRIEKDCDGDHVVNSYPITAWALTADGTISPVVCDGEVIYPDDTVAYWDCAFDVLRVPHVGTFASVHDWVEFWKESRS